jgi:hypothetical protein
MEAIRSSETSIYNTPTHDATSQKEGILEMERCSKIWADNSVPSKFPNPILKVKHNSVWTQNARNLEAKGHAAADTDLAVYSTVPFP